MKKLTRLSALVLAIMLTFLCTSCKGKTENQDTTTEPAVADTSADIATETATEEVTGESESISDAAAQTTETPEATEATTESAEAIKAPVGGQKAEIVDFYNNCANNTKAYSGKVTIDKKEGTTTTLEDISIGLLRGTAENMLPNDYPKASSRTFTNGKAAENRTIADFIPISDSAKMSTLAAAGVVSAKCVESGKGWKVTLVLKSETGNDINFKPPYHSSCMDTLALSAKDLEPFTLNNATITYKGATLTAEINEKGLLTSFDVKEPVHVEGDLAYKSFNLIEAVVVGEWKQTATFKY